MDREDRRDSKIDHDDDDDDDDDDNVVMCWMSM
jgi:hypothetical protein